MMAVLRRRWLDVAITALLVPVVIWLLYAFIIQTSAAESIGYHSAKVLNVIDMTSDYGSNLQVLVQIDDGRTGTYRANLTLLPALGEVICVRATAVTGGGLVSIWPAPMPRCGSVAP